MQRIKTINSSQSLKGQVYFRIMPVSIKLNSQPNNSSVCNKWCLYLQKGMQILGKTTPFQFASPKGQFKFENSENKFDFQIASEKNFNYAWSLYGIDADGYEERLGESVFGIRDFYQKYQKEPQRGGYSHRVTITDNFNLIFKIFIQNTATNLLQLVNGVVPQAQEDVTKAVTGINRKDLLGSLINIKQRRQVALSERTNKDEAKLSISQIKSNKNITKALNSPRTSKQPVNAAQQQPNAMEKNTGRLPKQLQNLDLRISQQKQEREQQLQIGEKNKGEEGEEAILKKQPQLQKIVQNKQKQDSETPMFKNSRYKTPGDINNAIEEVLNDSQPKNTQSQIEFNAKTISNSEYVQKQENNVLAQQNNEEQIQSKIQNRQKQIDDKMTDGKSKEKIGQPDVQVIPTKGSAKKIIIAILLMILIGGIIDTLLSSSQDIQLKNKEQRKKPKKVEKNEKASKKKQ